MRVRENRRGKRKERKGKSRQIQKESAALILIILIERV